MTSILKNGYTPDYSEAFEWSAKKTKALKRHSLVDYLKLGAESLAKHEESNSDIDRQLLDWARNVTDESELWEENQTISKEQGRFIATAILIGESLAPGETDTFDAYLVNAGPNESPIWYATQIINAYEKAIGQLKGPDGLEDEEIDKLTSVFQYFFRIGFLYRDQWWKENHEAAALRGYLAIRTAEAAGKGGAKYQSEARLERIKLMLIACAKLIRENPILRNDREEEVAFRAIKLAASKYPEKFKRANSKKTAAEYWEYAKSDAALWKFYEINVLEATH